MNTMSATLILSHFTVFFPIYVMEEISPGVRRKKALNCFEVYACLDLSAKLTNQTHNQEDLKMCIYRLSEEFDGEYTVDQVCRALEISRDRYIGITRAMKPSYKPPRQYRFYAGKYDQMDE